MSTTTTEVVRRPHGGAANLNDSVQYARLLAASNLLPAHYRGQPANVLWALEYGRTIGLTPMAAITGVHVIDGKPSASAGLISGLVRAAGHRLRVRVRGTVAAGDITATCTIYRSDDPEHPFEASWDLHRAARAGLIDRLNIDERGDTVIVARTPKGKPSSWEKYPEAMLKARATSEAARDACEEVLFGLHYTPEELGAEVDADGEIVVGSWEETSAAPAPAQAATDEGPQTPPEGIPADPTTRTRELQALAEQAAQEAASAGNREDLVAIWKSVPKSCTPLDVRAVVTDAHLAAAIQYTPELATTREHLPLVAWLQACAACITQGGTSVADASAYDEPADEPDPEPTP